MKDYPKVGVYVGKGASHSWTWFVDVLERARLFNVCFPDENHIRDGGLQDLDVLLVAGGDTFDLAEGLGERGSRKVGDFITSGGYYIGSCAGAYLMLRSSKQPLNWFNYVMVKVGNHLNECPSAKDWAARSYSRYRCRDIFHPVRDQVIVRSKGIDPFNGDEEMIAPLFGGPVMIPSEDASTLATYSGFTPRTLFLVDEDLARQTVLNNSAAIKKKYGDGLIYLFGPHFEHPRYGVANRVIISIVQSARRQNTCSMCSPTRAIDHPRSNNIGKLLIEVKAEISNARIVAIALQRYPLSWLIGIKTYEPAKIWHFLEVVWKRIPSLFRNPRDHDYGYLQSILEQAKTVTHLLRAMKAEVDDGSDSLHLALRLFPELKKMTARFLDYHFRGKLAGY